MTNLKIIIRFNCKWLVWADAMTLDRMIYVRGDSMSRVLFKHEFRHVKRINEVGVLNWYVYYFANYLFNLIKYRNHEKAYRAVFEEKDAYDRENDPFTQEEEDLFQAHVVNRLP